MIPQSGTRVRVRGRLACVLLASLGLLSCEPTYRDEPSGDRDGGKIGVARAALSQTGLILHLKPTIGSIGSNGATWSDAEGRPVTFTAGAGAAKPAVLTDANGQPTALRFSGAQYMTGSLGDPADWTGQTIIAVVKTAATLPNYETLWGSGANVANAGLMLAQTNGAAWRLLPSTTYILTWKHGRGSTARWTRRRNGSVIEVSIVDNTFPTGPSVNYLGAQALVNNAPLSPGRFDLFELVYYKRELSNQEALAVEQELGQQYSVPIEPATITPSTVPWDSLSVGANGGCSLRQGRVYCWGDNFYGQVGSGSRQASARPRQVGHASDWSLVASGRDYSCGIRVGRLYCWGATHYGKAGFAEGTWAHSPLRVGSDSDWSFVSLGSNHTCGIKAGGQLWCWGWNIYGQIGDGTGSNSATPVRVGSASDWSYVSAQWTSTCGIRAGGELYCWGQNGALGLGDHVDRYVPTRVDAAHSDYQTVSVHNRGMCAIRAGQLYCLVGASNPNVLSRVGTSSTWSSVSYGGFVYVCGIDAGKPYCWRDNPYGNLGTGNTTSYDSPQPVSTSLTGWTTVLNKDAFDNFATCGLRGGQRYCWGSNILGFGDVMAPSSLVPIAIDDPAPVVEPPISFDDSLDFAAASISANGTSWPALAPNSSIILRAENRPPALTTFNQQAAAVRFSQAQYLHGSLGPTSSWTGFTVVAVVKFPTTPAANGIMLGSGGSPTVADDPSDDIYWAMGLGTNSTTGLGFTQPRPGFTTTGFGSSNFTTGSSYVMSWTRGGPSSPWTIRKNGTIIATTASDSTFPTSTFQIYLGAAATDLDDPNSYPDGAAAAGTFDIAHLRIYKRGLSLGEITAAEQELATTYAVTIAPPALYTNGQGPCLKDIDCATGLKCGFGIAPKFGKPADQGVCWDPGICGTLNPSPCGHTGDYCGIECCVPDCGAGSGGADGCGHTCQACVPGADSDGDGLQDCAERGDNDPWTDALVFNGIDAQRGNSCQTTPTCSAIDTAAEVDACFTPAEDNSLRSGWDFTTTDRNICDPGFGFNLPWHGCGTNFAVRYQGVIKLDQSGTHCFAVDGSVDRQCGALLFGGDDTATLTSAGPKCYALPAGLYPIEWFYETTNNSTTNSLHVLHCFGGAASCTPTTALAPTSLRSEDDATARVCGTTCTELCPCPAGRAVTDVSQCQAGLVVRTDVAQYFNQPVNTPICWDPICDDRTSELFECGTPTARCGTVCPACTQSCGGKSCGYDGCWGKCGDGSCSSGQAGCVTNEDCESGLICFPDAGGRFDLSSDLGVCMPGSCLSLNASENPCLSPANQGTTTVCGQCPMLPLCVGKVCGPDGAGGSCGPTPAGYGCVNGQLIVAAAIAVTDVATSEFGTLPGDFSVSHSGEATYRIPLSLPRGRGDLTPQLALSYSSGRGNGLVGAGWALEGMQAITRCDRDFARDQEARPVQFDDTDAYCLNGERLVPTAHERVVEGQSVPEYALEHNDGSSVVAIRASAGSGTVGPERWEMTTPSGTVYGFGAAPDASGRPDSSNIVADDGVVQTWALSRITDRSGNYAVYRYQQSSNAVGSSPLSREYVPTAISYSMNAGHPDPQVVVLFAYEDRLDPLSAWHAGVNIQTTHRLSKIMMISPGNNRQFILHYGTSDPNRPSGLDTPEPPHSRLESVQQCADQQSTTYASPPDPAYCLPPTFFRYDHGTGLQIADALRVGITTGLGRDAAGQVIEAVGDFDADGLDDLLVRQSPTEEGDSGTTDVILKATVDADGAVGFVPLALSGCPHCAPDGKVPPYPEFSSNSTGGPLNKSQPVGPDLPKDIDLRVLDIDGDGRQDDLLDLTNWRYYVLDESSSGALKYNGHVLPLDNEVGPSTQIFLLDINGDGLSDLMSCTPVRPLVPAAAIPTAKWTFSLRDQENLDAAFSPWQVRIAPGSCPARSGGVRPSDSNAAGKYTGPSLLGEQDYSKVVDVDGDGTQELLFVADDRVGDLIDTPTFKNDALDTLDRGLHDAHDAAPAPVEKFISQPRPGLTWKILHMPVPRPCEQDSTPCEPDQLTIEDTLVPWQAKLIDLNGDGLQDFYRINSCKETLPPIDEICAETLPPTLESWTNAGAAVASGAEGAQTKTRFQQNLPVEINLKTGTATVGDWALMSAMARVSQALDFDGDGRQDVLVPFSTVQPLGTGHGWYAFLSKSDPLKGDSFDSTPHFVMPWEHHAEADDDLLPGQTWAFLEKDSLTVMDVNGDHLPDLLTRTSDNRWRILVGGGPLEPRLVGITNGLGADVEIAYGQLSDPAVYTSSAVSGAPACAYPQSCLPPRGSVVSAYSIGTAPWAGTPPSLGSPEIPGDPDGVVKQSFFELYQNARSDIQGRGFLGFGFHTEVMKPGDVCPGHLPGEICPPDVTPDDGTVGGSYTRTIQYGFDNYTSDPTTGIYYRAFVPTSVLETRTDTSLSFFRVVESSLDGVVLADAPNTVFRIERARRERTAEQPVGASLPTLISDHMHAILNFDTFGNPTAVLDGVTDDTALLPCRTDVPEGCSVETFRYAYQDGAPDAPGFRSLPSLDTSYFFQDRALRPWNEPDLAVPGLEVGGFSNMRVTAYDYDGKGRLTTTTTEPETPLVDLESLHKMVSVAYDDFGNVIARETTAGVENPETRREETSYAATDRDVLGWYPTATLDAMQVIDATQAPTVVHYDSRFGKLAEASRVATSDSSAPTITTTKYDDFGRLAEATAPDGTLTTVFYDHGSTGGPLSIHTVTAGGRDDLVDYDAFGRVVQTISKGARAGDLVSTVAYDAIDRVLSKVRPHYAGEVEHEAQAAIFYTYDAADRIVAKDWVDAQDPTTPTISEVQTCYAGRDQCTRNPRGFTSCASYDQKGRLLRSYDPPTGEDGTAVDPGALTCSDALTSLPNREASATKYAYGEFLERIEDPRGNLTRGNLTRIVPDRYGRRVELDDPDTGTAESTWNAFGELSETTDANGQRTAFEYDALGRRVRRLDYPLSGNGDPQETRWFYDGHDPVQARNGLDAGDYLGALSASQSPEGHIKRHRYNAIGQPTIITQELANESDPQSITFGSYLNGKPRQIGYPGFTAVRTYGPHGHLTQVDTASGTRLWELGGTDAFDLPSLERLGPVSTTAYARDNLSRIETITDTNATDVLREIGFGHDANSNVTARIDGASGQGEYLGYDQLDRLTSATVGVATKEIHYTPLGNIDSRDGVGGYYYTSPAAPLEIPDTDPIINRYRPHAVSVAGTTGYNYDPAGNVIQRLDVQNGHADLQSWTPFGKVHQMWKDAAAPAASGTGTVTFSYDADGNRILKRTDTQTTTYLEGLYEHRTSTSGSTEDVYYVSNGARVVAQVTAVTAGASTSSPTAYLHGDVVGTPELITDDTGQPLEHRSYGAFGDSRNPQNWSQPGADPTLSSAVHLGFTGQEHDAEYGLVNMNGRLYDPRIARFVSADPLVGALNSQGLNRYSYVRNNPLKYVDPSGYWGVPPQVTPSEPDSGGESAPEASPGDSWFEDPNVTREQGTAPDAATTWFREPNFCDPTGADDAKAAAMDTAGPSEPPGSGFDHLLDMAGPILGGALATVVIHEASAEFMGALEEAAYGAFGGAAEVPAEVATEGVVVEGAPASAGAVPEASGEGGKIVYRGGSRTPYNLTPRPGSDMTGDKRGLSTFDTLEKATPPGGKAQAIDTSKLTCLGAHCSPDGHVALRPGTQAELEAWGATKGTDSVHPYTQEVLDAIVETVRRPQ